VIINVKRRFDANNKVNYFLKSEIFEGSRQYFTIRNFPFFNAMRNISEMYEEKRFALYVLAHSKRMLPSNDVANRYWFSVMQMYRMYLGSI